MSNKTMPDELFICRRLVGGSDEGTKYFYYEAIEQYADHIVTALREENARYSEALEYCANQPLTMVVARKALGEQDE